MKPVIISALAQSEIDAAAAWYENRKDGLGLEFLDGVSKTLDRIETNPEGYAEGLQGPSSSHSRSVSLWNMVQDHAGQ